METNRDAMKVYSWRVDIIMLYSIASIILLVNKAFFQLPIVLVSISGIMLLLIMPGHIFTASMMPDLLRVRGKKTNSLSKSGFWIIPAASISLVSLFGFALSILGSLSSWPTFGLLFLFALPNILSIRKNNPDLLFFPMQIKVPLFSQSLSKIENFWQASFLVAILIGALSAYLEFNDKADPWVEFYVSPVDSDNFENIPSSVLFSEELPLSLSIVNHGETSSFQINKKIFIFQSEDQNAIENSSLVKEEVILLEQKFVDDQISVLDYTQFSESGDYLISYELFKTDSSQTMPFRSLQILISAVGE